MSVINKVLRDLDQRQSGPRANGVMAGVRVPVPGQGAAASPGGGQRGRLVRWCLLVSALMAVLALGGFLAWRWMFNDHPATPPGKPMVPVAARVLPGLQVQVAEARPVAAAPVSAPLGLRSTDVLPVRNLLPAPQSASATSSVASSSLTQAPPSKAPAEANLAAPVPVAVASVAPRFSAAASETVQLKANTVAKTTALPSTTPATAQPLKPMGQEALAQAQAWWQQGNQSAALELVRGIMARLEQSPQADAVPLAAAARDYVRMLLAQGRAADALALLVRLEPRLSRVADIWALRGNTAQRLGLHPQAVYAYRQALALQPGQARWLLGVAVSLAAQGQTAAATDAARQAADAGYFPVDVANYLQQLGVELRAP